MNISIKNSFEKILSSKFFYPFVFIFYFLFLFLLYSQTGIITNLEAEKYIGAASEIIKGNHQYSFDNYLFFLSYNYFLAFCFLISGYKFAVFMQIVLTIISAFCIEKIVLKFTSSNSLSKISLFLFLFSYLIQYWVITLFSESFFISITLFYFYFIICKSYTVKNSISIFLIGIILLFARPQGVLFILPSILFLFQEKFKIKKSLFFILLLFSSVALFYLISIQNNSCEGVVKPITESSIICGFPEKPVGEILFDHCTILEAHKYLIEKNSFTYDLKLCIKKGISFFTLTRNYYSTSHNVLLLLHYPFYILLLFTFFIKREINLLQTILFLNAFLIAITYNEWHGRYITVVFPLIIILGMAGVKKILEKRNITIR